jgi:small subunit ribosomal protein S6
MSPYELLYIIPATLTDDEVGSAENKVAALLAKHGATVSSTRRLGKFRLAYPIKTERHGHYVMVLFQAERPAIAKLEEGLRITPEVIRHLIVKLEDAEAEQKFDLVQFAEVNIEAREERPRRRERAPSKETATKTADLKAGVAALEAGAEAVPPATETAGALSSEELEKKIESALSQDSQSA